MQVQSFPEYRAGKKKPAKVLDEFECMVVKHFMLENPSLCNFCCDFMICCSPVVIPLFWWGDKSKGGQGLNKVEGEPQYSEAGREGVKLEERVGQSKEQGRCVGLQTSASQAAQEE